MFLFSKSCEALIVLLLPTVNVNSIARNSLGRISDRQTRSEKSDRLMLPDLPYPEANYRQANQYDLISLGRECGFEI